jgi:excisionase family DNA binding protein
MTHCQSHPSFLDDRPLTIEEAAEWLRITVRAIRRYRMMGVLPASKVGNRLLFRRSDLEKFVEGRKA